MTNHHAAVNAAQLAIDLQKEMDSKLNEFKLNQIASQNHMNSVIESFKPFQALITNIEAQEDALLRQQQYTDTLHQQINDYLRIIQEKERVIRDLGVGLAEANSYRDQMHADQQAKGSEISGLRADLERTAGSMSELDAQVHKVQSELNAKRGEVAANSAEVQNLQRLLAIANQESRQLIQVLAREREDRAEEHASLKQAFAAQLIQIEEGNHQLQHKLQELNISYSLLKEEMGVKSDALEKLEMELKLSAADKHTASQAAREVETQLQTASHELEAMRLMCGNLEDQWGEERTKLVEDLNMMSAQLQTTRQELQTCTERLETSMAEAKLLTTLKDLLKEEADKRLVESKLTMQRAQLRSSARLFVADFHRKTAEAAVEVSCEDAHQQRARHTAEEKALRAELDKAKQEATETGKRFQLEKENYAQLVAQIQTEIQAQKQAARPPSPRRSTMDMEEYMSDSGGSEHATTEWIDPVTGQKSMVKRQIKATHEQPTSPNKKLQHKFQKKETKKLQAERDLLAQKLEQSARDGLSERTQLLQALAAAKSESENLKRENRMNSAQVGSLNERAAILEKELFELKKSNSFAILAPNHAATAMRLRELEERSREAERRLRDAVEENVDLRERIESCEEVEMALRAAKEMLKSAEARVREAVEENSDLRKRLYKW